MIGGRLVNTGFVGTALAITGENKVRFVETRRWRARDWSDYETVICGGPRLVNNSRVLVVPRAEGFRDRSLFRRRPRMAVGLIGYNRLVMVSVARPIYLRQLARVMRSLGCRNAIALDGGSSSAMFYRGRFAARPHRSLTNLLVVYDSPTSTTAPSGDWRRVSPSPAVRPTASGRWPAPGRAPMPPTRRGAAQRCNRRSRSRRKFRRHHEQGRLIGDLDRATGFAGVPRLSGFGPGLARAEAGRVGRGRGGGIRRW